MKKNALLLFLNLLTFCLVTYGQANLSKGLVGYYKMDEADGEDLINLASGDDVMPDGLIINPVWSDTAVTGSSLYFDVEAKMPDEFTSYVDFGTYDPAQGGGKFTVSCWFYWNGTNGEYQGVTAKRTDWTNELVYWDICFKRDGPIQFEAVGKDEVKQVVLSDAAPSVRKWQNLTITYDGTTAMMFLDGDLIKQGQMSLGLKKDAAFMLGCAEPEGVTPFTGHIDEVRYYNRAISITEVILLVDEPFKNVGNKVLSHASSKIFPTRVHDMVSIKGEDLSVIKIYTNTGKLVLDEATSGNLARINVSDLPAGIYFVNAFGKEVISGKFIKR